MWKRLNNPKGARQPAAEPISIPRGGYVEDSYTASPIARSMTPETRAPPRPPRHDEPVASVQRPFEVSPPEPSPTHEGGFRPASSIYSQSSRPNSRFPPTSPYHNPYANNEDVSPPSSPEHGAMRSQNPQDDEVSPIDETPDMSRFNKEKAPVNRPSSRPGSSSKGPSSNIPIMRREKRRNQVAAAAQNLAARQPAGGASGGRTAVDPRWDPYSGEITTSDKGKPQSVKPGQFSIPALRSTQPQDARLGAETIITGPAKTSTSFGDRVRKLKNLTTPAEKPEWKGATGRVTLVAPVEDQMDKAPIKIPRKSSKRIASPPVSGHTSPVSVIRTGAAETIPESSPSEKIEPTIRPVFIDSGRDSPKMFSSPTTLGPDSSATVSDRNSQARRDLPTEVHALQKKDLARTTERNDRETSKNVSQFSATTHAPEARNTSRPANDTLERPTKPAPPPQQTSPVVNRKQPKAAEPPKAVPRKALSDSTPAVNSMSSITASKHMSNTAKDLPQSPPEVQSIDLISALEAQIENLATRRINITRSINQMTKLMPKDNVVAPPEVQRKREQEKLKVEQLREEEADVKQQEHELGLRLHRAYKRADKAAVYEPTGLWVRRITS